MTENSETSASNVKFEVADSPPTPLVLGMGLQLAILCIAGIILTPAIVVRAAGGAESFLSWAVFAAVLISGITTIVQSVRIGRIGAGYVLLMGTSGAFIAVCIGALQLGGPSMLCTLIVISAIFQFALAARLSLFRRVFTPIVSGTVIMLIAVTVMPIVFGMLKDVPEGTSSASAAWIALSTIVVMIGIALKGGGSLRLWAPVIGVIVGSIHAALVGCFDFQRIVDAAWFGLPSLAWPGFDLSFNATFWILLPSFILVTVVGAIETIGDSIAIQRVSWRSERAIDYRAVQGAVNADGLGNLLSGLLGTVPNTTYSTCVSVTELTGVAARRVGVVIGVTFIVLAFFPKFLAVVLAIPGPVVSAYVTVLISMLFVTGMRIALQEGIDYRKGIVVGVAFWLGVGLQSEVVFPEFFSEFAGGLFQNGMTAGGTVAIVLMIVMNFADTKRHRLKLPFGPDALTEIREFLDSFAAKNKWNDEICNRLQVAAEETLLTMLEHKDSEQDESDDSQVLEMVAYKDNKDVVLEFQSTGIEQNLQDQVSMLKEQSMLGRVEENVSLKILKEITDSVRHQQYHNTQLITIRVQTQSGGVAAMS
ncbi:MAG: hypothetical protein F4X44_07905 [Gammaproteobacteria bacterium]|nr:hypothetical protein [Gammaproteobacteria bacterium]MYD80521.1 hypothetical protein [Gammaproteobacteria bacterium]